MAKIIVLGVDGGSLKLIEQWKDELPNFRRFVEGGVSGELESTIPPVTCPAWPCMFTGKNPAKLGIYDFLAFPSDQRQNFSVHSSSDYASSSLWGILSDYDKSVGLLNVPMTYPPHKVNGFMVSGFGAPFADTRGEDYTYPVSLRNTLDKVVGNYEIDPPIDLNLQGKENQYINTLVEMLNKRSKAAKYLISSFAPDVFICVFAVLDRVQHYFWHHMDDAHPKHASEKYRTVVKDFYKKVDDAIGELLSVAPRDTNIVVVSDHGFQAKHGELVINRWLENEGFLHFHAAPGMVTGAVQAVRSLFLRLSRPGLTRFVARAIPQRLLARLLTQTGPRGELDTMFGNIDWPRTKAFALGASGSGGMIFINLRGRQPNGTVQPGDEYEKVRDNIIEELNRIAPPNTTAPFDIRVFRKEDIYRGEYLASAPDIVFNMSNYGAITGKGKTSSVWCEPVLSGMHAMEGVSMAYGPDIKERGEKLPSLKIYDITPTVLHMSGLPVSREMDGRVLTEIFRPDSELAGRPVAYEEMKEQGRLKERIKKLKKFKKI